MKQMWVRSLYYTLFASSYFMTIFFSWSPSQRGGGKERRGSVVRSVSLASLAPPTTVEALHTAGAPALSNGASATELHSNSVPCLPNGAAIGRTSAQALHPEQTETPPTKTELPSEQTAGTVKEDQWGFCEDGLWGKRWCACVYVREKMEGSERGEM